MTTPSSIYLRTQNFTQKNDKIYQYIITIQGLS